MLKIMCTIITGTVVAMAVAGLTTTLVKPISTPSQSEQNQSVLYIPTQTYPVQHATVQECVSFYDRTVPLPHYGDMYNLCSLVKSSHSVIWFDKNFGMPKVVK